MAHVIDPNAIYSSDEAAEILDLKAGTIRRLIRIGKLPATKMGTRRYYVRRADLLVLGPRAAAKSIQLSLRGRSLAEATSASL